MQGSSILNAFVVELAHAMLLILYLFLVTLFNKFFAMGGYQ